MALLILALLQRIFLMSSLMLLLVWLIFFMVLIKLLPILGTISGKTVKLMVVPSFVSGAMAKAGKGLLEGTLQAGTSAVSDKLLDLVGLGGKSAADKGKD